MECLENNLTCVVTAYPAFSTGSIFLITVVSLAAFGERPKKSQWTGLGLIVISLVLLGTGR